LSNEAVFNAADICSAANDASRKHTEHNDQYGGREYCEGYSTPINTVDHALASPKVADIRCAVLENQWWAA
jgi:hypothetical protein